MEEEKNIDRLSKYTHDVVHKAKCFPQIALWKNAIHHAKKLTRAPLMNAGNTEVDR